MPLPKPSHLEPGEGVRRLTEMQAHCPFCERSDELIVQHDFSGTGWATIREIHLRRDGEVAEVHSNWDVDRSSAEIDDEGPTGTVGCAACGWEGRALDLIFLTADDEILPPPAVNRSQQRIEGT